ncbi:hypothetical protein O6H91_18G067900 [Diphasiastrum complanatum]|uniref:Uncharacterized protein n=1 Tax=Diphasiastrum complanatum TaxID=34168 RepID=A0ACC2B2H6_DIPCM|nr:hypothetical protein O6H91_18G067900 [Diphasiastrum complanatum]
MSNKGEAYAAPPAPASSPIAPPLCHCSLRYYQAPYPPPCLCCIPPPICLPPPFFLNSSCPQPASCSAALHQNPRQSFPSSQTPSSLKASPWIAPFHPVGNAYYRSIPPCLLPSCIGSSLPSCPCFFYASPCPLAAANCFLEGSTKPFAAQASEIYNVSATPANDADINGNYGEQSAAYDIGQSYPDIDQFNNPQDRYDEGEQDGEEDDPQYVLTDEWAEFFAKSEARRRERKTQLKKKKQAARKEVRLSL